AATRGSAGAARQELRLAVGDANDGAGEHPADARPPDVRVEREDHVGLEAPAEDGVADRSDERRLDAEPEAVRDRERRERLAGLAPGAQQRLEQSARTARRDERLEQLAGALEQLG